MIDLMLQTHIHKSQAAPIVELKNLLAKWGTRCSLLNEILAHSITAGVFAREIAGGLLGAYAKLNKVAEARKIFNEMPKRDVGSWTSLQNLYLNIKRPRKSLAIFSDLVLSDFPKPDSHSVVAALSACARCKDLRNGRAIHAMALKYLEYPKTNVHNALIDMYGKNQRVGLANRVFNGVNYKDVAIWTSLLNGYIVNSDMDSAQKVFDEMPQKNVFSWTAMIVGHVRSKNALEALELFMKMRHEDVGEHCCNPTTFTVVALLSACADIGALNLGSSVHGYISKRHGFASDVTVNNGLMDMYGKSGNLDSAMKLFDFMRRKDLFSWSIMISGLALNGRGKDALVVFDSMVESGLIPNEVTFLSVLSACSHGGLVSEGERLFERFVNSYKIKPWIEHYGCMVDLFVRAGRLEKALWLVERMPIKPDAVIWRSLLAACLQHGNFELAEVAGKKVLELDPDDDAVYVLLFSIYRSKNRWDEAVSAMKMMRDQRIKKTPGCSWIEVNGGFHEFLAESSEHYVSDNIGIILNGLIEHSRLYTNLFLESS
ncbi:pentatricopeptide repeat-containing protein At2g22410, mitochondrial-like [Salvia splendens]|uniref:pentatricopeptide repeat-containing protein At2g22410, mitochondrial-like n=1 Tax=Salvia splendens TaxID=180675 RepID=UPI001C2563EE|nr:pentatricopeptide repeat-containing protein At2g22410, mitochondrial-like [Salvia splendens]